MYEYKVIPAPRKAQRSKGAKGTTERFAIGLQAALNEMGASGWSFVRSETLPVDERHGLLRKVVEEFHTVLIFRRPLTNHAAAEESAAQHRPKFFAEKAPAEASAPALGAATDANVIATPQIRAEKEPKAEPEEKPAKEKAASKAKKPAAKAKE